MEEDTEKFSVVYGMAKSNTYTIFNSKDALKISQVAKEGKKMKIHKSSINSSEEIFTIDLD